MSIKNICRITTLFVPPWEGLGPGPYEISKCESELGFNVVVITKGGKEEEKFDKDQQFKIIRVGAKKDIIFNVLALYKYYTLSRQIKFDIIHSHGPSALLFILLRRLSRNKYLPPIVTTLHVLRSLQVQSYYKLLPSRHLNKLFGNKVYKILPRERDFLKSKMLDGLLIKYSDGLAVVNSHMKNYAEKKFQKRNIGLVLNGVSDIFVSSFRKNKNRSSHFKILFIGRLNFLKGEINLLEAIDKLKDITNIKLTVIGDGPAKDFIKRYVYEHLTAVEVVFASNIPHEQVVKHYNENDLFVLPSYSEGLPKVLLEAMSQDITVLASDIQAHKDIIVHGVNGYLHLAASTDDLAEKIKHLISNRDALTNVRKLANLTIREHFTWKHVVYRTHEIFKKVINER